MAEEQQRRANVKNNNNKRKVWVNIMIFHRHN
jgi:hypothetical protein